MENMEEIQEAHREAQEPKSIDDVAQSIDLSLSASKIAEDNDRKTIVKVLEIHNVNFETLNISKSKFNKLNKEQLINALFDYQNREKGATRTADKKAPDVDYLALIFEFKDLIMSAKDTGDYTKLDGAVAKQALNALGDSQTIENINLSPVYLTRIILSLGTIYFLSRMVGFDVITQKINQIIKRVKEKGTTQE